MPHSPHEAFKWFCSAASDPHFKYGAAAQLGLGLCYEKGLGVAIDLDKASQLYESAANSGDATAMVVLGQFYESARGSPDDLIAAAGWYKRASDAGNALAKYCLHSLHLSGKGVRQDRELALDLLRNSAELGLSIAQFELSETLRDADDRSHRFRLLESAANQGHPKAAFELARCYELAIGTAQNYLEALRYYEQAAKSDVPDAMFMMGKFFEEGLGIVSDMQYAEYWYRKGAALDCGSGQIAIGRLCLHGIGLPRDWSQALTWFNKASSNGEKEAHFYLGLCYSQMPGRHQNELLAFQHFQLAHEHKFPLATLELARCFEYGHGCASNPETAVLLYEAASDTCVDAMLELGRIYELGILVPQDERAAEKYYARAAERGNATAQVILDRHASNRASSLRSMISERLVVQASVKGSGKAQYCVGLWYLEGLHGFVRDVPLGVRWLQKAHAQGMRLASAKLASFYLVTDAGALACEAALVRFAAAVWLVCSLSGGAWC